MSYVISQVKWDVAFRRGKLFLRYDSFHIYNSYYK